MKRKEKRVKTLKFNGAVADNDYKEVYDWFGMECVTPKIVSDFLKEADGEDVTIQINSGGGSVFAGSEIFTDLSKYQGKVIAEISGICASAATFVLLAANHIAITPIGQVMIHNVAGGRNGDYRDMDSMSKVLLGASGNIADLYAKRMNISSDEAQALMDAETWYNAKQAKESGLVDEILFEDNQQVQLVASMSPVLSPEKVNQFKNMINGEAKKIPEIYIQLDGKQMNSIIKLIDERIAAVKAEFEVNNSADKPHKNQLFKFGGLN
ncbi:MAG TPA: peptidase [Acinetobacter baumannii]|nr:peptidase [Acinetobacter baumannii]